MRRAARLALWIGLCVALLFLFKTPIQRLLTVIRLSTEELHPPLHIPVQGARLSALADTWGASRAGGRSHEGIDIFAPCETPVISAAEGIVLSVGENNLGGQIVWVFGPGGSRHYYAHLSRFADIGRGNHVQPGDLLGHVGTTGNAAGTSCHLHYGIYQRGGAQNPYPFLVAQ